MPFDTTLHHAKYARVVYGSKAQFDYEVQADDSDPDGVQSHDPRIQWNGGVIIQAEMDPGISTDGNTLHRNVNAKTGSTVLLVQRGHTLNLVATAIELSMNRELVDEDPGGRPIR